MSGFSGIYAIEKPAQGVANWHTALNGSIESVDAILGLLAPYSGFRLSAHATEAVPTADTTSGSDLYLHPVPGMKPSIVLPTASGKYEVVTDTDGCSLALSGMTNGKNYDVYAYKSGSALALELGAAWTTDTGRAELLAASNYGIYARTGAPTRRWLGTIRATGATTIADASAQRFVWNMYNQRLRASVRRDTTASWTTTSTSYQAMNAGAGVWKIEFIQGWNSESIRCSAQVLARNSGAFITAIGIGLDSTTANSGDATQGCVSGTNDASVAAEYTGFPGLGYHYFNGLQVVTGGTATYQSATVNSRISMWHWC